MVVIKQMELFSFKYNWFYFFINQFKPNKQTLLTINFSSIMGTIWSTKTTYTLPRLIKLQYYIEREQYSVVHYIIDMKSIELNYGVHRDEIHTCNRFIMSDTDGRMNMSHMDHKSRWLSQGKNIKRNNPVL